jgi:hypothetical protein
MLLDSVRTFLDGPRFAAVAYADAQGRPVLARTVGWAFAEGGDADLVLVCRPDLMPWVPPQGVPIRLAVVLSYADRFEALQLKGTGRLRSATPQEIAHGRATMATLGGIVQAMLGVSAALYQNVVGDGALAFDLVVEEVYQGSPGPGAGARLGADTAVAGGGA